MAAFIAIKFFGLTREELGYSLFNPETIRFYENVVKNIPGTLSCFHRALQEKWVRNILIRLEELLLPGDLMHILMRKYFIGTMVNQLKKKGYSQLIILGAGFDHLATYCSREGMLCLELDTPAMSSLKKDFLLQNGYNNHRLTLKSIHFLNDSLSEVLHNSPSLSSRKKTIIITEGFFDYVPKEKVNDILTDIRHFFQTRITLISTLFSLEELSLIHRLVFMSGVRLTGDKLRFHSSLPEFKSILKQYNFRINKLYTASQMEKEQPDPVLFNLHSLSGFYLIRAISDYSSAAEN